MPLDYHIQSRHRLSIIQLRGEVAGPEIKTALHALVNDPLWEAGYDGLVDARGVTRLMIDPGESNDIVQLARIYRAHFLDSQFAILVSRDMDRDLARLWKYMWNKEQCQVHVYSSLDEAREWLGVPEGACPAEH